MGKETTIMNNKVFNIKLGHNEIFKIKFHNWNNKLHLTEVILSAAKLVSIDSEFA